jgi:lichenan operon transcriptional antiterminator
MYVETERGELVLKDKEIELIQLLYQFKNSHITSKVLAEKLGISDRTVRTYIKNIEELIEANGAKVNAKQGAGFALEVIQPLEFEAFLKKNRPQHILTSEEKEIAQTVNPQNYLLNQLILNNAHLKFEDLMDTLFVSRSTLSKELSKIKEILDPFNLEIHWKANSGVFVTGKERDKRHFIMSYFFNQNYMTLLENHIGNRSFFKEIQLEKITMIVIEECRREGLKVYDFIIHNLVLHLALSIKRFQNEFVIKTKEVINLDKHSKEYQVAEHIINRVEGLQAIKFPKEEIYFLALHLFSKVNRQEKETKTSDSVQDQLLQNELKDILLAIEQDQHFPIANDGQLFEALLTHIYTLKLRILNDIKMTNPLLDKIKSDFNFELMLTKHYFGRLNLFSKHEISEDEWAYLTLHLMAAIERNKVAQKIRVIVICATGFGSAQLLQTRLIKEFGERIEIIGVFGYFELNLESIQSADAIITSIDLSQLVFAIPVIHVSVFFDERDILKVRSAFDRLHPEKRLKNTIDNQSNPSIEKVRLFQQVFKEDSFLIITESLSRDTIIKQLLLRLAKWEKDDYLDLMLTQLDTREHLGSVAFSTQIAVPHPVVPQGKFPKIAVAIIPQGVFWDKDFPNIQFIFLLSPSQFDNSYFTVFTKAVVSLLDLSETRETLLQVKHFSEFQQEFLKLI